MFMVAALESNLDNRSALLMSAASLTIIISIIIVIGPFRVLYLPRHRQSLSLARTRARVSRREIFDHTADRAASIKSAETVYTNRTASDQLCP